VKNRSISFEVPEHLRVSYEGFGAYRVTCRECGAVVLRATRSVIANQQAREEVFDSHAHD
jgi:hypothetical protein